MTTPQPSRVLAFAALIAGLLLAGSADAQELARVGILKPDGTLHLDLARFKGYFADGAPVERVEATDADGVPRVSRWDAKGCRGESTRLHVGDVVPGGGHSLWLATSYELIAFDCKDTGCKERFSKPGQTEASCESDYGVQCKCIERNQSGDNIIIHMDPGYCRIAFDAVSIWSLSDWVLPQFIH